jgi:hypothetical protein
MKPVESRHVLWAAMVALLVCASAAEAQSERLYFAVEVNGTVCGYSEMELSPMVKDGVELLLLKQETFAMSSALGAEFNTEVQLTYYIDPISGQFTYHDSDVKQGQMELWSKVYIEGDQARFEFSLTGDKTVDLPQDVILENTLMLPHVVADLATGGLDEKTYEILDVRDAEVQTTTYTKVDVEDMPLAGGWYKALVADVIKPATGLKYRVWIDTETGYLLKTELPTGRRSYRSGESIKNRIEMADLDDTILAQVNVLIADVQAISYMKVEATIEPSGLRVTQEGLNVPGQTFAGTVEDNLIDGIFEIEHPRYNGADAPPFPPDFSGDDALRQYLEPQEFIESDDPVLVEKARELTAGSETAWEAAVSLTEWVAENIGYAIPGGGTARRTYDIKAGECGAHSFLAAAFCRAVGIPARVVWGCMYVSNKGGSFGQHAWNEIYMGDAGWIPIDTTVREIDYLDSGHIRFGMHQSLTTSFNPHKMKVLDYRLGQEDVAMDDRAMEELYEDYLGKYEGPGGLKVKVFIQNGSLTVDIPGKMALAFDEPDAEGLWYCKLADKLFLAFEKDGGEKINVMNLHELIRLTRKSDPEVMDEGVPGELRPYLGTYLLPQLQAEFEVLHRDEGLAVYDPLARQTIGLQPPDHRGRWLDEFNKNSMRFETDDTGGVTAMIIDSRTEFRR